MNSRQNLSLSKLFPVAAAIILLMAGCATQLPPKPFPHDKQAASKAKSFDYTPYASLLTNHVNEEGLVDYKGILKDSTTLEQFYTAIATFSPDSHPERFPKREDKAAYWINAYNATVVKAITSYYPITSVHDVKSPFFLPTGSGFFFLQKLTYGGARTSLYYLENSVIRKRFDDPRIHFALNCASLGCPQLPQQPFYPETLSADLDRETRAFINDDSKVRFDAATQTLYLSSIFKWYTRDFTHGTIKGQPETKRTLAEYVLLYMEPDKRTALATAKDSINIEFLDYDWGLNDQDR